MTNIPARNQIKRLADLSPEEFRAEWTRTPFILTEPVREWPAYKIWSVESLVERYGETVFRAEAVDWTFRTYVDYMRNNSDEKPLYLFDRDFVSKMGIIDGNDQQQSSLAAYWPPACFGEDLFSVLGHDRPDRRWLIIGPARSGSVFHKDPNATSAWNAVLRGSKYWIMFPSTSELSTPPGVFVSPDQSEVTCPLSIAEWMLCFHAEARRTPGCLEGICHEGEVLHVPSGWWHLVVNLDSAIAVTQNFVPEGHLGSVLDFLSKKADQVSGFRQDVGDPYHRFVHGLRQLHPELLEEALRELQTDADSGGIKRKWDQVVHGPVEQEDTTTSGHGEFSFGFGDDSDAEVP